MVYILNFPISAEFTKLANFGGSENENGNEPFNRKSTIDELILESKKLKIEKTKEKEELEAMTNLLDGKWKDLIPVIGKMSGNVEKPKPDDFDRILRQMIFEPRGAVTDRLKPIEEVAKLKKENLEKLEKARLERMTDNKELSKSAHRSADDLDDGYFLNPNTEKNSTNILAYSLKNENIGEHNVCDQKELENCEIENDEESNELSDSNNGEDSDETEESEEEYLKDLSDLKDEPEIKCFEQIKQIDKLENITNGKNILELPFTYEVPKNYEAFSILIKSYSQNQQILLIDRMVASNHPHASKEGKDKFAVILSYLFQLIDDIFSEADANKISSNFKFLNALVPLIRVIVNIVPAKATFFIKEIIKQKQDEFKNNKRPTATLEVLIFLKIVSLLFSTSDFRHEVVTPAYIFISLILSSMKVKTRTDISRGLFLVSLYLEYSTFSKRILPGAIIFLIGTIFLAIKQRPVILLTKALPPFISTKHFNSLLALDEKIEHNSESDDFKLTSEDLCLQIIDNNYKCRALNTAVCMSIDLFSHIISNNCCAKFYAQTFEAKLSQIDSFLYPNSIQLKIEKLNDIITSIQELDLKYLVQEKLQRPKILRQLEPKLEKVYDCKKFKNVSKEKEEELKLKHKIKRETKGAIREIRRDNEFLSKIKLKQQYQSDNERREKVKRIFSEASVQQGELNAFERSKKRKK